MAKKYYYAVKRGKKPGIYETWDECKAQVSGYSGAIYKKFETREAATQFINGEKSEEGSLEIKLKPNEAIVYVDGSFRVSDFAYSFGCVFVDENGVHTEYAQMFERDEDSEMRNVAGEIRGAEFAMSKAIDMGLSKIYLHYDYEGIRSWALGYWKTNKEGTARYKKHYDRMKENLEVEFIKVAAHTGVKLNERVDRLAKEQLGI